MVVAGFDFGEHGETIEDVFDFAARESAAAVVAHDVADYVAHFLIFFLFFLCYWLLWGLDGVREWNGWMDLVVRRELGGKGGGEKKGKKVRGVTDTEHVMNNMCGRERERESQR